MKKSLLLLFILVPLIGYLQNTFNISLANEFDQSPWGLIRTPSGNYIAGISSFKDDIPEKTNIYLIDSTGNILKDIDIKSYKSFTLKEIISLDEYFFIVGSSIDNFGENSRLIIKKFNFQLDSLNQFEFDFISGEIGQTHSTLNHDGNVVISGFNIENHLFPKIFICEIDTDGNLIEAIDFLGDSYGIATGILEKKDKSGYYLFTDGFLIIGAPGEIAILHNNFEIDTVIRTPNDLDYQYSAKWISDNEYILAGRYVNSNSSYHNEDIGIIRADTTQNFQYHFETGLSNDRDSPAFLKSMDFISSNNIYFGGTYDYAEDYNYTPYQDKENVITLCNFNETLDLNWQIYYGGDAFYNLYYVLAVNDGSCLLLGTKYDINNHLNYRDIFLIKVDSLGNYTTIRQPDKINNVAVYPNPGTDIINIKLPNNVVSHRFQLFNITGKLVLDEKKLTKSNLNISSLKPGIYFYKIYGGNQLINSGKWIKQ